MALACLGIESTAHTLGAAVVRVEDGEKHVLSNVRDAFTTEEGGLVPAELAEHHVEVGPRIVREALAAAGVSMTDVGLVAYSRSPGIGHSLRVGLQLSKALAARYDVPLVGVNHCVAHLEVGRVLAGLDDPVLLYASGANTQVIAREGGAYRVFGETLDLGVGNFLDTIARDLGLGFPGGPKLERLASSYDGPLVELPYTVKGMDVSFSGLQTLVRSYIANEQYSAEAIAFSLQEHVFAMLVEVSERALAHTGKDSLVLGGGVACNARLQEMCRLMCGARGCAFFAPDNEFLVDNAAMIALLGLTLFERGVSHGLDGAGIDPYERTDEVAVPV